MLTVVMYSIMFLIL